LSTSKFNAYGVASVEQRDVELGERFTPSPLAWLRKVTGKPLGYLQAGPSVRLVVKLDPESRLERSEAIVSLTGYPHDAFEQYAIGDVGQVDIDVDLGVEVAVNDLDPTLKSPRAYIELHLLAR
jgi:hypothetical protein